jgi:DNA-binding PadR family transcriptional regulator
MAGANTSTAKWMEGSAASLRGALLGLLIERPGHRYDLANRLITRLGPTWRINQSDVYRLLQQLENEGLACRREEPKRGPAPGTRSVYHPTDSTSPALTAWMETGLPLAPMRTSLQAMIAVAREQDAPCLIDALKRYEQDCLRLLQIAPAAVRDARSWKALALDCARAGVEGQLRQEIAWAQQTRRRISEHARSA